MDGTTQLSAEDLMGWSKARELEQQKGWHPDKRLHSPDCIPHSAITGTPMCTWYLGMHHIVCISVFAGYTTIACTSSTSDSVQNSACITLLVTWSVHGLYFGDNASAVMQARKKLD